MKHITAKEGTYNIILHATDVRNRTNEGVLSISASDAVVLTKEVTEGDIWTSRAVLRGGLMKETSDPLIFRYRITGSSDWKEVEAVLNGKEMTAAITGLKVATTYEYVAVAGKRHLPWFADSLRRKPPNFPMPGLRSGMVPSRPMYTNPAERCFGIPATTVHKSRNGYNHRGRFCEAWR